jgi:hypothetical protein
MPLVDAFIGKGILATPQKRPAATLAPLQFDLVPPRGYFASAMAAHHSGSTLAAGSRSISWAYADRGVSAGLTSISRALRPVPPDSHLDCPGRF